MWTDSVQDRLMSIGLRPGNRIAPTAEPPSIVRGLLRFIVSRLRCIKGCGYVRRCIISIPKGNTVVVALSAPRCLCRLVVDPTSDLIFRLSGSVLI